MVILIGVDDSKHSQAAIAFVRGMAWPAGTRVLVVSAVRELVPAYSEVYAPAVSYSERLAEDLFRYHEETAAEAERTLREAGLDTTARVIQGDPRAVLVDLARSEHADLIVLGSHGRTGLAKLLLGSVAAHVVSHAPCSVLVVKVPAAA